MRFDPGFGRVVPRGAPYIVGGGWRGPPGSRSDWHMGLDISMPEGTPILAAADGVVAQATPITAAEVGGHVRLLHANGVSTRYLHFRELPMVQVGQRVSKGQQIGLSGNTGMSRAPHLHFDMTVPPHLVAAVLASAKMASLPATGSRTFAFGTFVPSETWLPVDGYTPTVVATARSNGIPLYPEISHTPQWLMPAMLLGAGTLGLLAIRRYRQ